MRHTRKERIYSESYDSSFVRKMVKFNTIKYWVGVGLAILTIRKIRYLEDIVVSFIFAFMLSNENTYLTLTNWAWAFLFSLVCEVAFVEGGALVVQTVMTMVVGSAPDSCGKCRNCCLSLLLQSIKDTVK